MKENIVKTATAACKMLAIWLTLLVHKKHDFIAIYWKVNCSYDLYVIFML